MWHLPPKDPEDVFAAHHIRCRDQQSASMFQYPVRFEEKEVRVCRKMLDYLSREHKIERLVVYRNLRIFQVHIIKGEPLTFRIKIEGSLDRLGRVPGILNVVPSTLE